MRRIQRATTRGAALAMPSVTAAAHCEADPPLAERRNPGAARDHTALLPARGQPCIDRCSHIRAGVDACDGSRTDKVLASQRTASMSQRTLALLAVFVVSVLVLAGGAWAHQFSHAGVTVVHPWARATPGGAKVGGVYFEMTSAPGHADRLIGARTPAAQAAELHNHVVQDGIVKMRRVEAIALDPGTSIVLKPGGYHIMLVNLAHPLKEGDLLKLTLLFEKAGELDLEATIEGVGATGPHGLDGQPASNPGAMHTH